VIDTYTLKARLWPALISGLPAAAVLAFVFPNVEWWHAGLMSTGAAVGLTFLLAQMARAAGKRKEPRLFEAWGGKPTTRYLRHRDSPLDRHTLARYHQNIMKLDPQLAMPSPGQEAADPLAADAVYDAATRMLIQKTRDTKRFRLLFKENMHFGFCRNLWGLKPIAILISLISAGVCGGLMYRERSLGHSIPPLPIAIGGLCIFWLGCWLFWFRSSWIRVAADGYAERLLEASDDLVTKLDTSQRDHS